MRLSPVVLLLLAACRGGEITFDPSSPEGIASFCAEAEPVPTTIRVEFPANPPGCPWGEGENLAMAQGVVTARAEAYRSLEIPEGQIVCDLAVNFQVDPQVVPTMEYDDNMFFLYNGVILAASYGPMVDRFTQVAGLPIYTWTQLAGMEFGFDPETPSYCLGEAEGRARCDIPPPETRGPLVMDFDEDLVDELSFRAFELGTQDFGFVVIGDNDPEIDCRHDAFAFDVTVDLATP